MVTVVRIIKDVSTIQLRSMLCGLALCGLASKMPNDHRLKRRMVPEALSPDALMLDVLVSFGTTLALSEQSLNVRDDSLAGLVITWMTDDQIPEGVARISSL